jgi:hypothetical protein
MKEGNGTCRTYIKRMDALNTKTPSEQERKTKNTLEEKNGGRRGILNDVTLPPPCR